MTFSYVNNELTENEIKKIIPFTIASKRIKYLGKKFNQGCKISVVGKLKDTKERNWRRHK